MSDIKISDKARKAAEAYLEKQQDPMTKEQCVSAIALVIVMMEDHERLAINEACRPLVEALQSVEKRVPIWKGTGDFRDADIDVAETAASIAAKAIAAHRKEHGP